MNLTLLRNKLTGPAFKKTLAEHGTNKYRISQATGIAYRTFFYWQKGIRPSEKSAILVGEHLGLITNEDKIDELKEEMKKLQVKLDSIDTSE